MDEIIFVTGNIGKQASLKKRFNNSNITVGITDLCFDEPNIDDIEYIAKEKVLYAYSKLNKPCIALDSGFYIPNYPNIPNFPGAFPRRELLDKIGIEGLLYNMKDVDDRYCYFKEVLAYYDGETLKTFNGILEGHLSKEVRGKDLESKWSELWYVFVPQNETKTMAEMSDFERANRKDNQIYAMDEFVVWYKDRKVLRR